MELSELRRDIFNETKSFRLTAKGRSMFPILLPKDVLIVNQSKFSEVQIGDIIVFERNEKLIAHRVIRTSFNEHPQFIVTQGDSCMNNDGIINENSFFGLLATRTRRKKTINLLSPKHRTIGKTICHLGILYRIPMNAFSKVGFFLYGMILRIYKKTKNDWTMI